MTSLVPVFYCFVIFIICRLFKFQIQVEDFLIMVYWEYHSHCFDVVFHKIVNFEISSIWKSGCFWFCIQQNMLLSNLSVVPRNLQLVIWLFMLECKSTVLSMQGWKKGPVNGNYWSFLHYHRSYHRSTFLNCSVSFAGILTPYVSILCGS